MQFTNVSSISLTPAGHLVIAAEETSAEPTSDAWTKRIGAAFASSQAAGLFALAAARTKLGLSPSVAFWRDFAALYLVELCRIPDSYNGQLAKLEPRTDEFTRLIQSAPPMKGAEYLTVETLTTLWHEIDAWVHEQLTQSQTSLSAFLREHAPIWHQVGRVCFHLAENKNDDEYPFAFLATYAPRMSHGGRVQYQPLSRALQEYADERNKQVLINLLSPVQRASEKSEFVRDLLDTKDIFHPMRWTPNEAHRLLKDVPLLEESGLLVRLPDWWKKRPRPRVKVTIGNNSTKLLGKDAILDFKSEVVLGDTKLTQKEVREILNQQEGLFLLKGQWIEVNSEQLSQALEHWTEIEKQAATGGISFNEGMRLLAGANRNLDVTTDGDEEEQQWSFINAGDWLGETLSALRDPQKIISAPENREFRGTLRQYQKLGHDWLWFLSNLGLGACLADDMGLGKTVQILSLLMSIKENNRKPGKPSILILPASLLGNWKSEIEKFAPTLSTLFVHPAETAEARLAEIAQDTKYALQNIDLVVTTYGMLLRQSWLQSIDWRLVIIDEAQAIKNPGTKQTKEVKKLRGESRIALTGTPVENRLSDLWSIFDFLSPGLLGSPAKFKEFIKKLNAREHNKYAPLRNLVNPYILRRLKTDKSIISDLPDKTEMKVFCGLSKEQLVLYKKLVADLAYALESSDKGIQRKGLILSYLTKFKQLCNHPAHLIGNGDWNPAKSGKFDRLKVICDEIASRQEKALVFTQFREMTDPVADYLASIFGQPGLVLHGEVAVGKRKHLVDQFQREDGPPYMVLTVKAGGTGLNLTAASHVVHFDRWWNPAVENQATDRAYRIGQHRNVLVHKFVCRGTIEDKSTNLSLKKPNWRMTY